jgi:UDP-N-acetylglucosamine 1-carboxyvinyltransferase
VALMSVAEGSAIVTENIYDGRFQFVDELVRMGADVRNEGRHAIVRGVERLTGAPVTASDVRAGAALVLAGLVAEGETIVHGGEHVDRGYPDLAATLRSLGADVERI